MKKYNLEGWDASTHRGFVRYVVIREGKNTGERMVILITAPVPDNFDTIIADCAQRLSSLCSSFIHGVNSRITDVSVQDTTKVIFGSAVLHEKVNDIEFHISPFSFFQTNTNAAGLLQQYICQSVGVTPQRILDLYCGVGFFTLPLAKTGHTVCGVELIEEAIAIAKKNAEINKITNVEFIAMKAEDHVRMLTPNHYDTIIVDPPRAGMHPRVLRSLITAAPSSILYVSCNPERLAVELPTFLNTYSMQSLALFDMFPHTPHVEVVMCLERKT